MNKVKKLIITSAAITLLTAGVSFQVCKTRDTNFEKYLKKFQSDQKDDLTICAHRGYSSLEVENTYEAISLASSENYIDCIEIDARMTKDGKIILSHDDIIYNEEIGLVKLSNLTYEEIVNMTFSYSKRSSLNFFWYDDEQIMINNRNNLLNDQKYHLISLSEGLQACGDKTIILDLKFNNDVKEFTEELKREVVNPTNIIFQSFNIEALLYLQENSDFECMPLVDNIRDFKYLNNFKRVSIEQSLVTTDLIKELVDSNIKIAIWTINSSSEINSVLDKVNGYYKKITYITNYPDLILTRINERRNDKKLVKTNI